tara:strand:+ start:627 stop:950 length:324 start_codon:yes stop_codon:yes gene_type:complete
LSFFEEQLKKGIFHVCNCKNCDLVFWPTQKICNKCGKKTSWNESSYKGILIEFSNKDSEFFGLVEINKNIRLLGKIISSETPHVGQFVKMKVGFEDRPVYTFIVEKN